MLFRKKRLKRLRWRDTRSPPSANQVAGEAAENVEESRPPPERHKSSKMMKAKSAMHTLSAIASHSFDIVRELSDSFGPLKGAVNGVLVREGCLAGTMLSLYFVLFAFH